MSEDSIPSRLRVWTGRDVRDQLPSHLVRAADDAAVLIETQAAELVGLREQLARPAQLLAPAPDSIRMDAYYWGFDRTGVGVIDRILSAIARAGKAYHSTESWDEPINKWVRDEPPGPSHWEEIQLAAVDAAAAITSAVRALSVPAPPETPENPNCACDYCAARPLGDT